MLGFKSFIAEGGNITFGKKGDVNAPQAAPFPVTSQTRGHIRNEIHSALGSIHDTFHKATGEHLFGKDKQRLHDATAFSGSSHDLMGHHVSHEEFAKHKPSVGDVDVQVSKEHKDALAQHLQPGHKHGNFTVVGVKKHGDETSVGLKHNDTGHIHQVDFEGVKHPGSESDRFLHSSNWEDTKAGIKGAHHKILINAVGGEKHKFSISHGLRSRTDESDPGATHPREVAHTLFGPKADESKIHSFQGVTHLIKKHVPAEQHQAIYDKFKSSLAGKKDMNHGPALAHMRQHLGVHDSELSEGLRDPKDNPCWKGYKPVGTKQKGGKTVPNCVPVEEGLVQKVKGAIRREKAKDLPLVQTRRDYAMNKAGEAYEKGQPRKGNQYSAWAERDRKKQGAPTTNPNGGYRTKTSDYMNEESEQHAHVAFMGASPHTHMGHHIDVVGGMGHGKKFVGLSGKSDVFSDKEREDIANKQSGGDAHFKVEKSAGQTVGRAFNSMTGSGKKHLHLHFGHDRKEMAERLKSSIEAGKIPELEGHKPDAVHIHYPKDEDRSHGMSGTKMRTAAETNDVDTYKKHLGSNFSDKEAKSIMDRTRVGLMAGKIKVKR